MSTGCPPSHKPRGAPFQPGNPGRPKGARNLAKRAFEESLQGAREALTKTLLDAALGGDRIAMRLCLDRLAPKPKDMPVAIDIPPIRTSMEAGDASAAVVAAMAAGEITPSEAAAAVAVLKAHADIVGTAEFERRIAALEK